MKSEEPDYEAFEEIPKTSQREGRQHDAERPGFDQQEQASVHSGMITNIAPRREIDCGWYGDMQIQLSYTEHNVNNDS